MKSLGYLFAAVLFIFLSAFSCLECTDPCYSFTMEYRSNDYTRRPDSLLNLSENLMTNIGSGPYYSVQVNPEKEETTFVLYSGWGLDTVIVQHHFVEYYDDECSRYIFTLNDARIVKSTFSNYSLDTDWCIMFTVTN